jgi:hypothetical protein
MSMRSSAVTRNDPGSTWLFGPRVDLLLGAGGAYLISLPLIMLTLGAGSAQRWPGAVIWVIAIVINGAHYGATLLRVYEQRAERRRYAIFSVWLTCVLLAAFILGVYDTLVGSALVTLYVTWSPWHFAGQNYGIAVMFLRRSGVEVDGRAKRLLYVSFVLSFVLAFLALHVEGASNVYAPTRNTTSPQIDLLRLGIPRGLALLLAWISVAAYLSCLGGALALLWRSAGARRLAPVLAIVLCQALWFVLPALHDVTGTGVGRGLVFAAIWVSAAHSIQYLWITLYYTQREQSVAVRSRYLLKTLLAGNAAFVIPGVLFASHVLGGQSWDAGLGLLIFSVVNVHHFFLDGAIWKLRDGAVARALLRSPEPAVEMSDETRSVGASRWWLGLWLVGAACLLVEVGEGVQQRAEERGASVVASTVLDGLAWAGRDHEGARIRLGRADLKERNYRRARHEFERSVATRPTVAGYAGLGRAMAGQGDLLAAADAYDAGLRLAPTDVALLQSAAGVRLRLGDSRRAEQLATRALAIEPGLLGARRTLEKARQMGSR